MAEKLPTQPLALQNANPVPAHDLQGWKNQFKWVYNPANAGINLLYQNQAIPFAAGTWMPIDEYTIISGGSAGMIFLFTSESPGQGAPASSGASKAQSVFESAAVIAGPPATGQHMCGFAQQIRPLVTGRLKFTVSIGLNTTFNGNEVLGGSIFYGTGTPPTQFQAGDIGTQLGNTFFSVPLGTPNTPDAIMPLVGGIQLVVGTLYWFDVAIGWGSVLDGLVGFASVLEELN